MIIVNSRSNIRSIALTETFHEEDNVKLSEEELKEVYRMQEDEKLRRRDPAAYDAMIAKRIRAAHAQSLSQQHQHTSVPGPEQAAFADVNLAPQRIPRPYHISFVESEDLRLASRAGVDVSNPNLSSNQITSTQASGAASINGPIPFMLPRDQRCSAQSAFPAMKFTDAAMSPRAGLQPVNKMNGQSPRQVTNGVMAPSDTSQLPANSTTPVSGQVEGQVSIPEDAPSTPLTNLEAGAPSIIDNTRKKTIGRLGLTTPSRPVTPANETPKMPLTPSKSGSKDAVNRSPVPMSHTHGIATPTASSTPMSGNPARPDTPSQTTPKTPSRSMTNGPIERQPPAASPMRSGLGDTRVSSSAGSTSAKELKRKRSGTGSAEERPTPKRFVSTFKSLNDAFTSGTNG